LREAAENLVIFEATPAESWRSWQESKIDIPKDGNIPPGKISRDEVSAKGLIKVSQGLRKLHVAMKEGRVPLRRDVPQSV
jgi:hypothetical protein